MLSQKNGMSRARSSREFEMKRHNRGFGIVEIMVGLVVGLLSMMVIVQVYSTFENQKRTTTSGADAQTNGAMALYLLEREIRAAGNGITEGVPGANGMPPIAGCDTWVYDNSGSYYVPIKGGSDSKAGAQRIRFAPAVATDSADLPAPGGASDSLTIVYGTSAITGGYDMLGSGYAPGATTISLVSTSSIHKKDMVVLVEEDVTKPTRDATAAKNLNYQNYRVPYDCLMFQVTDITPSTGVLTVATTSPYNKPGGFNGATHYNTTIGKGGVSSTSQLFNLGQVNIVTYHIVGSNLVADSTKFGGIPDGNDPPTNNATNSVTSLPLAPNIVNMQVQYGVDTGRPNGACPSANPPPQAVDSDAIVDSWVDPTGATWGNDGAAKPSLFDLRRIRAVRIGLVARSAVMEKGCDIGNAATLVTSAAPIIHWDAGPNMTPDLSGDANWQCYRYKVYQVTVPMRNTIWSSTLNPASATNCGNN
jgi:type IV pilus assembly protein PilW